MRTVAASSAPPLGTSIAGRYTLSEALGRGAMGSVWLAMDDRLERRVAVKILATAWAESPDVRKRFAREARAVAKLRSPHIVQVFDYGIEGKRPYIVMELLNGEDLQARIKRCRKLSVEETARILVHTCRGLHVAHEANIVHRDIKPGNLMIDTSTGEELVKVLDFGVAKATSDLMTEETKAGVLLGTPKYMAPEQARGLPDVDRRADLWSVAVIAYRLLTGKAPFRAKSVTDMIVQICTATPPRVTEHCPELPPTLDAFFDRALARSPDKRFNSARELATAFVLAVDQAAPSLTAFDTGRFASIDSAPDSFPSLDSYSGHDSQVDSRPRLMSQSDILLQTSPTLARSSHPGASQSGSESSVSGAPELVGTLSSGDALDASSAAAIAEQGGAKKRGALIAFVGVVVVLLAVASLWDTLALATLWDRLSAGEPRKAETAAQPGDTTPDATGRTEPSPSPSAPAAEAVDDQTQPTTSASAGASGEPAAHAATAQSSSPAKPHAPPVRRKWRARPKPPPDDGDLLGERF